jgi:creatinine amidohydrolase
VIRAAAEQVKLLIAPPLPYGYKSKPLSGGGQGFPGTTSLDGTTLIAVVRDVVGELARHGFRRIVVFNWHMENINFVYEGIDQARRRGTLDGVTVMSIDSIFTAFAQEELAWLFAEGFPGWDVEHAAIMETSLMLSVRPELVRVDRVVDDRSQAHPWYDLIPAPPSHVPPSGTLSLATQGSKEKGDRLQAMLVDRFVAALRDEFGAGDREPLAAGAAR